MKRKSNEKARGEGDADWLLTLMSATEAAPLWGAGVRSGSAGQ